jgi:hypothetical protein
VFVTEASKFLHKIAKIKKAADLFVIILFSPTQYSFKNREQQFCYDSRSMNYTFGFFSSSLTSVYYFYGSLRIAIPIIAVTIKAPPTIS